MKKIFIASLIGATLLLTGCGKKEIVEVKPNEVAYSIANFSEESEKTGGDKSQKFDGTREYWQTLRTTNKLVTIPYERRSTGAISWVTIPSHKIVVVSQSISSKDWVSDVNRGTSAKDDGFKAESSNGAEFTVGITLSAKIKDTDTYLSIYGTDPNSRLSDAKVEAIPLDIVLERTIRPFIQGSLSAEFSKYATAEIQPRKNDVVKKVAELTKERFEKDGIEILTFNGSDTLTWSDDKIQKSINETAQFLAQKERAEAEQKVKQTEAQTLRIQAEETNKAEAKKREIEAQTKQKEAEYSRLADEERNKQELAKAQNDRLIALENAKKDTEVANEKSKVINVEKQLIELEIKRAELEVMKKRAEAELVKAQKWNGKEAYSELTITGANSIVDKNGTVKTMNLVK